MSCFLLRLATLLIILILHYLINLHQELDLTPPTLVSCLAITTLYVVTLKV